MARLLSRAAAASAVAALVVAPLAAAHGGGGSLGFRSEVTRVTPAGVEVRVRDYDDRLRLRNETGKTLKISGYAGEPYLVFEGGRVLRNTRSPATYLNDERFGDVSLPAAADAKAEPAWEEVAEREEYEWHDHRIHWMSRALPPKIAAASDREHLVFDWKVPGWMGGERLFISGTLRYEPPPDDSATLLIGALVVIATGGAAVVFLRQRRERRVSERA